MVSIRRGECKTVKIGGTAGNGSSKCSSTSPMGNELDPVRLSQNRTPLVAEEMLAEMAAFASMAQLQSGSPMEGSYASRCQGPQHNCQIPIWSQSFLLPATCRTPERRSYVR